MASLKDLKFLFFFFFSRPYCYAPPPFYLPAPNARSSECAVYYSVLVVVDVVEVNVIMGAGLHALVSCFAANNNAAVEVFIQML